ncbi:MAG: hypothetical protein H0W70_05665 [Actinobacteria bacterium]|nr:hypothetical protein [Actinomycetota bacterium]
MADDVADLVALGRDSSVRCPNDDLEFRPFFTGGACPLCGYRAEGRVGEPWTHRVDWVWVAFVGLVAVSILMAVIVFVAL